MVKEGEKNPNLFYLHPVLLEEIFLRLPGKSLGKFTAVSKEWKTVIESRTLVKRRLRWRRKILAAYHCDCSCRKPCLLPQSQFAGDEEIVYMHCHPQDRTFTCNGLVCIFQAEWINVFNPSTTQLLRFPSALDIRLRYSGCSDEVILSMSDWDDWAVGFGRDKVTGRYKVMMLYFLTSYSEVLDVETGEWRVILLPYEGLLKAGYKSVCVDGTIYWLGESLWLIAWDLHREVYRRVPLPDGWTTWQTQIANFDDRLAIAQTEQVGSELILEIRITDAHPKVKWNKLYSISIVYSPSDVCWFLPVTLSKQGNLVFSDNHKRLFKYYPQTNNVRCLSSNSCVMSLYLENLDPLPVKPNSLSKFSCHLHWICFWGSKIWQLLCVEPAIAFICLCVLLLFMGY